MILLPVKEYDRYDTLRTPYRLEALAGANPLGGRILDPDAWEAGSDWFGRLD